MNTNSTIETSAPAKSLEQLKQEAEAAAQALRTAEQAKREKWAIAKKAKHDKWLALYQRIAAVLKKEHEVEMTVTPKTDFSGGFDWEPEVRFPGCTYSVYLNTSDGGSLKVASSGHGGANYRVRENGTWNVDKIAAKIAELYAAAVAADVRRKRVEEAGKINGELARKLYAEIGLNAGSPTSIHSTHSNAGRVSIKLDLWELNEADARKVLNVLKDAGLTAPFVRSNA